MASTQQTLFDVVPQGGLALGLPKDVEYRAAFEARKQLVSMPRYSRYDTRGDGEVDVLFIESRNEWVECMGAMGITMTPRSIALGGARHFLSETMGVRFGRFEAEASNIADQVAAEYISTHTEVA